VVVAARVLVVDDERNIRELVGTALRYEGFEVVLAERGREAIERAVEERPDLIVLDVMLPDLDGFEVVRRLRRDGMKVPVVFLSARDATGDKVEGLSAGGDDYLAKPFSLDELVARVRAVLRRTGDDDEETALRFADLELDDTTHEVRRDGDLVALTPTEYKLLRLFLLNPRRVLSKSQILDHVWGYEFDGNLVETYVRYLRRKLDAGRTPLLHTVRGAGYVLRLPEPVA
jgi:two-component system, OmpR family, response regulator